MRNPAIDAMDTRIGGGELTLTGAWFLQSLDEFHLGGRPATVALFGQLDVAEGARLLDVVRRLRAATTGAAPPPLGLHLVMGDDVAVKVANLNDALEVGTVSPVELIATRRPA